jgi:hypothetical protein
LGFVLGSLLYIGSPSGFGLGQLAALHRRSVDHWNLGADSGESAFSRLEQGARELQYHRRGMRREILQAAQIHDVEVVETNDFLGDHYDPTKKRLPFEQRLQHAVGRGPRASRRTRPGTPFNTPARTRH